MEIFLDNTKTLGNLIILRNVTKWFDFDTKKELGIKVNVVLIENDFEKITVKIPNAKMEDYSDFEVGKKVKFVKIVGTVWNMGVKHGISFKAENMMEVNNG